MSQFSPFQSPDGTDTDYGHTINVSSTHAAAAREKGDLPISRTPLSLWALLPICGVVLAAGSYLGVNVGWGPNLKGYAYELTSPDGEGPAAAELPPYDPKVWLAKGKAEFGTVCITCHGANGEGSAGQYPPLKGSEWVLQGEERLVSILLHGITGPITVKGSTFNGLMPAQSAKNDKAIGQLASYIRNEWGNSGSLIYDDQVKVVRDKLAGMGEGSFTEAALLKIDPHGNLPPSKRPAEAAAAAASGAPAAATPQPPAGAPAAATPPSPAGGAPSPAPAPAAK